LKSISSFSSQLSIIYSICFFYSLAPSWKSKRKAIDDIGDFVQKMSLENYTSTKFPSDSFLIVVKTHTRSFKESNFNLMKSIMDLFLVFINVHVQLETSPALWICKAGATLAVEKISDRKLSNLASVILTELCVVKNPSLILNTSMTAIAKARSPVAHEALLKWCVNFCKDFGVAYINDIMRTFSEWIIKVSFVLSERDQFSHNFNLTGK